MTKTQPSKKSPLKQTPLRQPGQALDEKIRDIPNESAIPWLMLAIFAALYAFYEWIFYFIPIGRQPIIATLAAIAVAAVAWRRINATRRQLTTYKLGRDGERVTAELLDELRATGHKIYHDIQTGQGNIDHVIVGPKGIFTVETKTRSKSPNDTITYDGERITIDGYSPTPDPLNQAKAQAKWLHERIKTQTGRQLPITPTIVYPAWYIHYLTNPTTAQVKVYNPNALITFINRQPDTLNPQDIQLFTHIIAQQQRT